MGAGGQARTRGAGAAPACQCRQVDMRDGSLGGLVGLMTKSREAAGAGPGRGRKAEPARGDGPGISGAQPLMLAAVVAGTEVPVCCASAGYSPPRPPCFPWASSHTPGHLPQDRCELSHHFHDGDEDTFCTRGTEALLSCPQGPSQTPAGSTSSSRPATTGTCSCSPPAAGCTRGQTTGRPFWTASGPAELDCALGFSRGPWTSGLPAQGPSGGGGRLELWPLGGGGLPLTWPRPTACLSALPSPARP